MTKIILTMLIIQKDTKFRALIIQKTSPYKSWIKKFQLQNKFMKIA